MLHSSKADIADAAGAARRALEAMARPSIDFDSSRYFRADGDLGFYNVGTDAMRALHRVRQCSYDLVLVDLLMPKANGMSLISRIKEISPNTTVVVVSGIVDQRIAVLATDEGSEMCLCKPVDGTDLDRILQFVEGRKKPVSHED